MRSRMQQRRLRRRQTGLDAMGVGAYLRDDGRHCAGLFKAPPKKAVLSRTQFGEFRMEDRDGQAPTDEEAVSR